jgi:hypothetical protein
MDDYEKMEDWMTMTSPADVCENVVDGGSAGVLCQRNQFTDMYYANQVGPGLYFYDQEYVTQVDVVAPGVEVEPLTELLVAKLADVPSLVGYFSQALIVGGRKKKKSVGGVNLQQMEGKLTKALSRLEHLTHLQGKGKVKLPGFVKNIGHAMAPAGKQLVRAAKSAVKEELGRAIQKGLAGAGAYGAPMMLGNGSYSPEGQMEVNGLINNTTPSSRIISATHEGENLRVKGFEFVSDIYNSTTNNSALAGVVLFCNPGLSSAFAKLCQLANYVKYRFRQLVLLFKSDVQSIGGNIGEVIIVFNYNPGTSLPNSKVALLDYHGAVAGRCDRDIMSGVECDNAKSGNTEALLLRSAGISSSQSIQLFDFGTINVYTNGISSSIVANGGLVGRFYIYYDVECYTPRLNSYLGYLNRFGQYTADTGLSAANWFGAAATPAAGNNDGGTAYSLVYQAGNNLNGRYLVQVQLQGTVFANTPSQPTLAGNMAYVNAVGPALASPYVVVATSTACILYFVIDVTPAVTSGGNYIQFVQGAFTATTLTYAALAIQQMSPSQGTFST